MLNALRNLFASDAASRRYVAIDIEIIGVSPQHSDRVVQPALSDITEAVQLARMRQTRWSLDATSGLINPQRKIPEAASRIHGI